MPTPMRLVATECEVMRGTLRTRHHGATTSGRYALGVATLEASSATYFPPSKQPAASPSRLHPHPHFPTVWLLSTSAFCDASSHEHNGTGFDRAKHMTSLVFAIPCMQLSPGMQLEIKTVSTAARHQQFLISTRGARLQLHQTHPIKRAAASLIWRAALSVSLLRLKLKLWKGL